MEREDVEKYLKENLERVRVEPKKQLWEDGLFQSLLYFLNLKMVQ